MSEIERLKVELLREQKLCEGFRKMLVQAISDLDKMTAERDEALQAHADAVKRTDRNPPPPKYIANGRCAYTGRWAPELEPDPSEIYEPGGGRRRW